MKVSHALFSRGSGLCGLVKRTWFVHGNSMGRIKVESVSDLARHKFLYQLKCRCGHTVTMTAAQLLERLRGKKVRPDLDTIAAHAKCDLCDRRGARWSLTLPPDAGSVPVGVDPIAWVTARDDRERKRLIREARG